MTARNNPAPRAYQEDALTIHIFAADTDIEYVRSVHKSLVVYSAPTDVRRALPDGTITTRFVATRNTRDGPQADCLGAYFDRNDHDTTEEFTAFIVDDLLCGSGCEYPFAPYEWIYTDDEQAARQFIRWDEHPHYKARYERTS
jgi:hypothetical protein